VDVNYVIMPWGRVGSHLLIDVLRQSGCFKIYKEPETGILSNARDREAAKNQQSVLWESLGLEARSMRILCNVNLGSVVDLDEFFSVARSQRGSFIYLDRKNVIKTAISILKARLYSDWHKQQWGASSWAIKDPKRVRSVADKIDVTSLRSVLNRLNANREKFYARKKDNPGPLVFYEDMQIDLRGVVCYLCQELNLDMFQYEVRHFKAVDDNLRTEISNFTEIADFIGDEFPGLTKDLQI
jgi:LPS sulfotransferase NodH